MNRNTEQFFATNPSISVSRSKLDLSHSVKLTGNVGRIIPFEVTEVVPGDSFKVKTSKVIRLSTPVTPFMDNLFADFYHFFVPNRLVYNKFQNVMGESEGGWIPENEYELPKIDAPSGGWSKGTIADYMGVPIGKDVTLDNALPFRAYAKIIEDWFRSDALDDPVNIPLNESKQTGSNGDSYINDLANGGMPFIANKTFDLFTGCLPSPQRGNGVEIPLGQLADSAPVYGTGKGLAFTDGTNIKGSSIYGGGSIYVNNAFGKDNGTLVDQSGSQFSGTAVVGIPTKEQISALTGSTPEMTGLVADIAIEGGNLISISELRSAFQIQKWLEKLARGGSRYISIIKSFFGVTSADARLQRSEYLGGSRVPIQVSQVLSTNGAVTNDNQPLGTTGAYSLTLDSHYDFERGFTEHGLVISCMVIRYEHTYQQGLPKIFTKSNKFDFYWPVFANLSEMAVKNKEIYLQDDDVVDESGNVINNQAFGFNEAWYDYRYQPNRVCGELRSDYTTPLDYWHLGDDYSQLPSLSSEWLKEDLTNVDRVLTVASTNADQFIADIYITNTAYRPMPVNSIPGLIDHH